MRILTLDGGGAKGFYTLGVLKEIETMLGCPLHQRFNLVFGTNTGAIIAALIALGYDIDAILRLYRQYVPRVMSKQCARTRSKALRKLAHQVFGDAMFSDVKTDVGIIATNWRTERPMVFKGSPAQKHRQDGTFAPSIGISIADAVTASYSEYPFFERMRVTISKDENMELIDGGYCANNPTLYALADAIDAFQGDHQAIRLVNLGVGTYPTPEPSFWMRFRLVKKYVQLFEKTLDINTNSLERLRQILFADVPIIRISDTYTQAELATSFLEHNPKKLNTLYQLGRKILRISRAAAA